MSRNPENKGNVTKSPVSRRLLLAAGVLSVIYALGSEIKSKVEDQLKDSNGIEAALSGGDKMREKFNINMYAPPREGVIIGKKVNPSSKKTILFIPDIHVNYGGPEEEVRMRVQVEQFLLLKDLIEKYGRIHVAIENIPEQYSAKQMKDNPLAHPLLRKLLSMDNRRERKIMAENLVGKVPIPAMDLMLVAYEDEIVPVGTVANNQSTLNLQGQRVANAKAMLKIIRDPGRYSCTQNGTMSIEDLRRKFKGGIRNVEIVECYCKYNKIEEDILRSFEEREKVVPVMEVNKAIEAPGDITVLVAGGLHLVGAVLELEARGVNYLVVAPVSSIKGLKPYMDIRTFRMKAGAQKEMHFPDDSEGTCRKMAE